ncbi:MAG: DUF222 domain-containing protein, partial [Burkholderiales bacterium]
MLDATPNNSSRGHSHNSSDFVTGHLAQSRRRRSHLQQLEEDLCELAAHIDAAMFRWLELLCEFDDCEGWAGDGIKSCAHWLNWKCGLGLAAARERVRVAHALPDLPETRAAFSEGRLSYSKVRAITRVATPRNEDVLLNIAFHGTTWHVERAVSVWRREKRLQALEQENHRHDIRELNWYFDDDGCLVLKARFTPEQGAVIRQAVEAEMEAMFEERKNVSAETSGFEAVSPLKQQPQPIASRRADALARMAESWLSGQGSCSSGDRFVVNVHTDLETLRKDGSGAESELEDNGNVSAETSRRLACDAGVVHWLNRNGIVPGTGEPLSVGRKTRTVPPAIRRALQRRDGGCRFPGCTCTRFVDAHHIHHWADGGETDIDNLVLLCRHHHRLVHEGGFGLSRT